MRTSLRMAARWVVCAAVLGLAAPAAHATHAGTEQSVRSSAGTALKSDRTAAGRQHRSTSGRRKRARRCSRRRCAVSAARRPTTTIASRPESTTISTAATFAFRSSSSSATYQCRLDGASTWSACSSPKSYSGLQLGAHRFEVRAVTSAGADRSPATASWTVTAPSTASEPVPATTEPVTDTAPSGCTVANSAKPTYTTGRAELVHPMAAPLADGVAAGRVHRSTWEPRPQNTTANRYVPSDAELSTFWTKQAQYGDIRSDLIKKVTGRTGLGCATTDEILQWASHKWGLSEEIERAQAQNESTWTQSAIGDGGVSYGILQIKSTYHTASYPLTQRSTAFNADWAMAYLRTCIDRYSGDYWGCLGKYFSGSYFSGGQLYIQHVKEKLAARAWLNW